MNSSDSTASRSVTTTKAGRVLAEIAGLVRSPRRLLPLVSKIASDEFRTTFAQRHLYSYASTTVPTADALQSLITWIVNAQRSDGGIAAYYSLLTGYSDSYPEVTGYIIPTLHDFAHRTGEPATVRIAERATQWLLSLQMPSGAFPAGLRTSGGDVQPSVFNTGQILQGLVRAHEETKKGTARNPKLLQRAIAAGDWLVRIQQPEGSWTGPAAYQGAPHTYYSMVAWSLALLAAESGDANHARAANKNIDWVLSHVQAGGWIDGINLQGHPIYLHFIAYVIQGVLECGILHRRDDAIQSAAKSAWVLLRRFETHKRLSGAYEPGFRNGQDFSCLTGNAQMSCCWLRLFEVTGDLRYLNAALKINEMLKQSLATRGPLGVIGGVAGSRPIWGAYQPMRFISWGCKFMADALLLEQKLLARFEPENEGSRTTKPEAKLEVTGCV